MEKELNTQPGLTAFDETELLKAAENIITVNVNESVKTEDEILFMKQVFGGESETDEPALILPTDLEIYAKGIETGSTQETIKNDPLHKCRKNCDKLFETLTQRLWHETHEHKNAFRKIKCNFCNETFENFFALTRHMHEHRNEQRYVCPHCFSNFNSYLELQSHWKASAICKSGEEEKPITKQVNTRASYPFTKNDLVHKDENINLFSNLSSNVKEATFSQQQPLSFAEEVKAFAAKYQLKTVAKKRTSSFTLKPVEKGTRKKRIDFEFQPNFAVPTAINPLQNLKIKEEPNDEDEEMATTFNSDFVDHIQVKNEPYDDFEILSEEFAANTPIRFEMEKDVYERSQLSNKSVINDNNVSSKNVIPALETIIKGDQQQSQPHPKVLLSKANLMSMKNVKILKLGSLAKNDSPPLITPAVSPEKKEPEEIKQENTNAQSITEQFLNSGFWDFSTKIDVDANMFPPQDLKTDEKTENIDINFSEFQETTDDEKRAFLLKLIENIVDKRQSTRNLPKWVIRYLEEQPQNKKIIHDLQRQFQNAKEIMKLDSTTLPSNDPGSSSSGNCVLGPTVTSTALVSSEPLPPLPESFFLKVYDSSDKELMSARRHYQGYNYAWICPMCYKEYTQRHIFINHLIGRHKMSKEKLKTLTVEVKPFLMAKVNPEQNLSSTQIRETEKGDGVAVAASDVKVRFECSKCKRTYVTKQAIIDHESSDCGRIALYVCKVCSKPFASRSTLNCHMTIHTGELPYQCQYCDKRFRTNGQVRVHERKHTGEKPFKCQICTLSFTHRETLISHLSRHMDIKRYICKGCDKRFSTISALTTHRNVRPTTCGKVELDTRAVGPLIRVTQGQIRFEPQRGNSARARRKIYQEILAEIQNIPKNNDQEQ